MLDEMSRTEEHFNEQPETPEETHDRIVWLFDGLDFEDT